MPESLFHTIIHARRRRRKARVPALLLALPVLTGCSIPGFAGGSGSARLTSAIHADRLDASFTTRAYTFRDADTADIFLTDLSAEELTALFRSPGDAAGVTGNIAHVHLFLRPRAGRTPIQQTASSATVRHMVIAQGQIGVYAGAGFMMPGDTPGGSSLSGSLSEASARLVRQTPGFVDRLGSSRLDISFSAPLDEELADDLARRFEVLTRRATRVQDDPVITTGG